ncbi:uncharacterized protein LOC133850642 [Drosophila sulfurigaster albostrigata]|uniref:uncharacterized protein LOC133850642 n=1 Tax=Drosophila sulfurigaster albostrigata TaxID=89887 RepID=UPI002D21BCD9|nr:uncharacterized protein LOC133850642 [Drosophila sulfurigaster albostrigata]
MEPRPEQLFHYQQQPQDQQQQQQRQRPQTVVFMTRRPEQRPESDQVVVYVIDELTLQMFIRKVYLIAIIFILSTSVTWLSIAASGFEFYPTIPVPFFVWLLPILPLILILDCVPKIRYTFPWNWAITILIVILITFAGACFMDQIEFLMVLLGVAISIVIVAAFYVCGALCPQSFVPGMLCTAVMSCLFLITLFSIGIVLIFVKSPVLYLVFGILLLCMTVVIMPFHAQYIHGRLQVVPLFDVLHCSMTIYFHFIVTFSALCIFEFYMKHKDD